MSSEEIYEAGKAYSQEQKRVLARQIVLEQLGYVDEELVERVLARLNEEQREDS